MLASTKLQRLTCCTVFLSGGENLAAGDLQARQQHHLRAGAGPESRA